MPIIYRSRPEHLLSEYQIAIKSIRDKDYEIAVKALSTAYYQKKRSIGVTLAETLAYQTAKATMWNDYVEWAKVAGIYEAVSIDQQITEIEESFDTALASLNSLRAEKGVSTKLITETSILNTLTSLRDSAKAIIKGTGTNAQKITQLRTLFGV